MTLEALIFDLDGTIADTEEMHRQAFNAAFIKLGLWWDWGPLRYSELLEVSSGVERLRAYVGALNAARHEKAALSAVVPSIHAVKSEIYLELVRGWKPPLRAGVKRLIGEARDQGLPVAVVSTSATASARAVLDNHFTDEIAVLVCSDEVAQRKPAPDLYLRAAALLRRPASACAAFEDSANGLRAARAAGMTTIITPSRWTMAQDFGGAHALLPDLERLKLDDARRIHHAAHEGRGRAAA